MARKINLKQLYNNGNLIVTPDFGDEDASSNGIGAMFDADESVSAFTQDDDSNLTKLSFDFSTPLQGNKFMLKVKTTLGSPITIDPNDNTDLRVSSTPASAASIFEHIFNINVKSLSSFELGSTSTYSNPALKIFNVELFVVEEANPYEFNDSVLTTKAWNSSRYTGKQLQGAKINEYTSGDVSYANTPVIENYTRNIYVGNDIINITSSVNDTLLEIPNFCYATINQYITVNEDGTISKNLIESKDNNFDQKNGWYRSFFDDFPLQSNCKLLINNTKTKTNLKEKYKIYFNGGQLQKLIEFQPLASGFFKPEYIITYTTASNEQYINLKLTAQQGYYRMKFYNEEIYNNFFTGQVNIDGFYRDAGVIGGANISAPFEEAFNYKNTSNYKADKRYFATFLSTGSSEPIRTLGSGSIPVGFTTNLSTKNLAELSTIEIYSSSYASSYVRLHTQDSLSQNYDTTNSAPKPQLAGYGYVMISKVEDAVPSLLLNIPYEKTFPNGISDTNFIIVPENLHPYIKDNLEFYIIKAGIDVGGNATDKIEEQTSKKPKQSSLTLEQLRERAAQRRAEFEERREEALNQTLRGRIQLKREENAEKRNEKRLEREQNREERKQKRQETRQDRREDRQDRRENRRNRRRNR